MKNKYYAGIDVGGTKIAGILSNGKGKIISRIKSSTPKDATPEKIVRIISDLLEELLDAKGLDKKDLSAVGVGIPGIIDPEGKIIRTPNLHLSGVNLGKQLKKKLKVSCRLGNDVNLGLLGEKWLGAAKRARNVISLFIGTGIGAGIILDNKLICGTHGAAAEIGHMVIQENGPKCSCGNSGCLEALAGRWAIERNIRKEIKKGRKTIITKLLDKKSDSIKSRFLRKALQAHDPLVTQILETAAKQIGIACVSIRHIFDPQLILLGGGVVEACGDFILPIVKKTVQKDSFFPGAFTCEITLSELGDDAVCLGAVALASGHF